MKITLSTAARPGHDRRLCITAKINGQYVELTPHLFNSLGEAAKTMETITFELEVSALFMQALAREVQAHSTDNL